LTQPKPKRSHPAVAPARAAAFTVIRRVFEQGAYADRAFTAAASGLDHRDRALAMQLSYGTVQRRATLDHVAARLTTRAIDDLDAPVLAAVRLGLFQLLFLGGVAEHAAVNDSVELAKRTSRGGSGLVNAVLRRAIREARDIVDGLEDSDPQSAALKHSVPPWLAELWWAELGGATTRALLERINAPAESALRVNTLTMTPTEAIERLPVKAIPAPGLPEGLVLGEPFDSHGSSLFRDGAIMPQSRGSMLVARVLAPEPGERILDLCAAPGAKTTHVAALIGNVGDVVAVERHPGRAQALERTCERLHATSVRVQTGDATTTAYETTFDRVLVDPPCSGLGTLQSRPDIRWRATPEAIAELADLQTRILASGAQATRPGGVLVYSVCTISRRESEDVIERFLNSHDQFRLDDLQVEHPELGHPQSEKYLQLLPHRDGTDGFFIARLRRADG
jgi:16S rRNA (cytosine967-C5)-methyltransferase